jgi:SAM-dependent MidA family methyltransferase
MSPLEKELRARIERDGPICVADYMAACNAHYYSTRDPLGRNGDFITAPEISQMFGELVGAWLADLWSRAGRPANAAYVELGPGRGTLAADALRAMGKAGLTPPVHFVETSPTLRAAQAERLADAIWHDEIASLPDDRPLLIVANEFFDALPVHQYGNGGRELGVAFANGRFVRDQADTIVEVSHASLALAGELAARLRAQGGAMLIIDYGGTGLAAGDTLQAVSAHAYADPWEAPGTRDLTALVDFSALTRMSVVGGAHYFGPVAQGDWLEEVGIGLRAEALTRAAPSRAGEVEAARARLTAPDQMGRLFKVLAVVAPGWPHPAGFPA